MLSDLRYALRNLLAARGFTIVAVVTLAFGVGAATAMFSALRALVIEPFSYPESGQIVYLWSNDGQPLSTPDYFDFKDQAASFESLGVYSPNDVNLGGEHAQAVRSVSCTAGVLQAFGIPPAYGRWIEETDEKEGAPRVAVISYSLWKRNLGGDPDIVGQSIRVNGSDTTVVGIMPADFEFSSPWMRSVTCEMWLPLQIKRGDGDRGSHWMCAIGRLKEGVTPAAADAEVKAIGARLKAAYPDTNSHKPFLVRPLIEEMTRFMRSRVWMLFGGVVLVLLVACANVASMQLARSTKRQSEFGIRIALGASRAHIVRLALIESLVLALAGTLLGLVLAYFGVDILRAIAPTTDARRAAMVLNGNVLLFSLGVTLLAAFLAGIPPALASTKVSVTGLLQTDGRGATGSRARHSMLRGLIIAQVAVAFVLANGAALFSTSYVKLLAANDDLATEYVIAGELNLRGESYKDQEVRARFCEEVARRVATLPGVTAAGLTTKLPLEGGSNMNILVNDEVFDPTAQRTLAEVSSVTPKYFDAVGIALLRGRTLEPQDNGKETVGVVVNRTLAENCWPGEDAIGKTIRPSSREAWFTGHVVGVVEDVRQWGAETKPKPEIYWPPERAWGQTMFLLVRSPHPAATLTPTLREEISRLDSDLPLAHVRTLQQVVDDATKGQRAIAGLVNFFMATALGLVAVGLYGTLSYHMLQRTREIGVRVALGAFRGDIVRLVFTQGARWVAVGLALGIGGALALASVLRAMVYDVSTLNPLILIAAVAAVGLAAFLACWLPARRASRIDPMDALRSD